MLNMKAEAYGFVAVKDFFKRKDGSEGAYIKLPIHAKLPDGGFAEDAEIWLTVFLPDEASDRIAIPEKGDRIRVAGYFQPDAERPDSGVVRPMELEILAEGDGDSRAPRGRASGGNGRSGGSTGGSARSGGSTGGSRSGGSRGGGSAGGSSLGGSTGRAPRAARGRDNVPF